MRTVKINIFIVRSHPFKHLEGQNKYLEGPMKPLEGQTGFYEVSRMSSETSKGSYKS